MLAMEKWIAKRPEWFQTCKLDTVPVCSGWSQLLDDVFEQVDQIIFHYPTASFQFLQIKEKFGGLRIYWQRDGLPRNAADQIAQIISNADTLSFKTCEICGSFAALGSNGQTYMVRCISCAPENWKPVEENLFLLI